MARRLASVGRGMKYCQIECMRANTYTLIVRMCRHSPWITVAYTKYRQGHMIDMHSHTWTNTSLKSHVPECVYADWVAPTVHTHTHNAYVALLA